MIDLSQINLNILQSYSYFFILLLMFVEGPMATTIFSFLASFGFFNIFLIFSLAILGNVIPDLVYFSLGKYMRKDAIERLLSKTEFGRNGLIRLENRFHTHLKKTIVFIKLAPFVSAPGIMLAGFLKIPYKRFFSVSIPLDLFFAALFSIVGYYSGVFGLNVVKYLKLEQYIIPISLFLLFILYLLIKKVYKFTVASIRETK